MFGLTFEKLLLVAVIAAVVIGPHRLPAVTARVASVIRGLRQTVDAARVRAATELGVPADADEWRALDPRQYDPRRIIAEAFAEPAAVPLAASPSPLRREGLAESAPIAGGVREISHAADAGEAPRLSAVSLDPAVSGAVRADDSAALGGDRPAPGEPGSGFRRVRRGTSAHPRWVLVPEDTDSAASLATAPTAPGAPMTPAAGDFGDRGATPEADYLDAARLRPESAEAALTP